MANTATNLEPGPISEVSTRRCARFGQREFLLRWDDRHTLQSDVRALGEALESAVAAGARYEPGATIRVGWVPLRVIETPSCALLLFEPDFLGAPLRYAPGVDAAVGHLRAQQELAVRVGMPGRLMHPSLEDTVRLCPHVTTAGAILDRTAAGWLVGCGLDSDGEDRHELVTVTLYDLVCRLPHLTEVLALPINTTVACTDVGDVLVWHDGVETTARLSRVTRNENPHLARSSAIR